MRKPLAHYKCLKWVLFKWALIAPLIGCGGDGGSADQSLAHSRELELESAPLPDVLTDVQATFFKDVAYDEYPATELDILLPDARSPTGLILYVHEGGFIDGDKSVVYADAALAADIREILLRGVAYATVNYRLLEDEDEEGVIKPLKDVARSVQFLRFYADQLNLDPERVALYGHSAGAGASLWLAMRDDLAEIDALDPVLRESTRVSAVGALETQASYDLLRWGSEIFSEYPESILAILFAPTSWWRGILSFYGIVDIEDLQLDKIVAYREEVDMLLWMSADDPPMWVENTIQPTGLPTTTDHLLHHPLHAWVLKQHADAVGVPNVAHIPKLGVVPSTEEPVWSFLIRHL